MSSPVCAEVPTIDGGPLPARWSSGRCARGHDITDPANRRRSGRRRQWLCLLCERYRSACRWRGLPAEPAIVFPDRVCEHCERTYGRTEVGSEQSQSEWAKRRFCSETCRRAAWPRVTAEAGRETAQRRHNGPLDEVNLGRLRAAVGFRMEVR